MTPRTAARRLVATALNAIFNNVHNLIDPDEQETRAYAETLMVAHTDLEDTIRVARGYQDRGELNDLYNDLLEAVPREYHPAIRLHERFTLELMLVKQRAAHLIGVEAGQALRSRGARAVAEGGVS